MSVPFSIFDLKIRGFFIKIEHTFHPIHLYLIFEKSSWENQVGKIKFDGLDF